MLTEVWAEASVILFTLQNLPATLRIVIKNLQTKTECRVAGINVKYRLIGLVYWQGLWIIILTYTRIKKLLYIWMTTKFVVEIEWKSTCWKCGCFLSKKPLKKELFHHSFTDLKLKPCNSLLIRAFLVCVSARDGNRTRTDITVHRILSPACLPIPPPELPVSSGTF